MRRKRGRIAAIKAVFFSALSLLFIFQSVGSCFASSPESYSQLVEYLAEEKTNLTFSLHDMTLWTKPSDMAALVQESDRVKQTIILINGKLVVLDRFRVNQETNQRDFAAQLKRMQHVSLTHPDERAVLERIAELDALREANNKALDLIKQDLLLAANYKTNLMRYSQELVVLIAEKNTQAKVNDILETITRLEANRAALYENNISIMRKKKLASFPSDVHDKDDGLLYLNNQNIMLIDDQITMLRGRMNGVQSDYLYLTNKDIGALDTLIMNIEQAIEHDQQMLIAARAQSASLRCDELGSGSVKSACLNSVSELQAHISTLTVDEADWKRCLMQKQNLLRKQLASRQSLTEYNLDTWMMVMKQVLWIPFQFYDYVSSLLTNVIEQYLWDDFLQNSLVVFVLVLTAMIGFFLYHRLAQLTQEKARSRLSGRLYDGFFVLLQRNMAQLTVAALMLWMLILNHLPYSHYRLFLHLMAVWFVSRQFIMVARLMLLERLNDVSGYDVKLYYRLKWLILMGGISTGLMIYSHEFPLSFVLQDLFDRLFMLFILTVSLVFWKSRDVLPYLLPSFMMHKKPHVKRVLLLLGLCIPITLLTTAFLGLMGYINLAWSMSRYEAYVLIIASGYVLARGLLGDALDLISEWMVTVLHNGWLWVEAILKPLDKLLRFALVLISVLILLYWFGLLNDPTFLAGVVTLGQYALIHWAGVYITLFSLAEFIALLLIFIWATKWSREFCYRWLYAHIADPGIRNSFSVFTQYGVVLFGCFLTLRVLGIDFTGMMVVLGGLAVGMGFGLRDFASNIVGGIMLLIERPVREGDLITIGEHEGRVAHIGIRSMRVSSWDNMEVLVPNAETFNKPFTNWTHQDSVVRSVVPIKVSRADDPEFIQHMIYAVLSGISEILNDPAPQVYLKQIDEALIEFEVRYFINVQLHTRFEIRSKVLLAIMSQFKLHGIKPPVPPLAVALTHQDKED